MFWTIKDNVCNVIMFDFRLYLFLVTGSVEFNFCSFRHDACRLSDVTVIRSRVRRAVKRLPCLQSSSWGQLMIHVM